MNLKGVGLLSVLKEHFNRFTCVFARKCYRHVCGKSVDKIRLFRERLSEKVHTTNPKGIVGGFEFTVLQRNLKKNGTRGHGLMFESAKGKQQN